MKEVINGLSVGNMGYFCVAKTKRVTGGGVFCFVGRADREFALRCYIDPYGVVKCIKKFFREEIVDEAVGKDRDYLNGGEFDEVVV